MFKAKSKKIISSIVLLLFVFTIPSTALAEIEINVPYKITVIKQETDNGQIQYKRKNEISLFSNATDDVMTAVWDENSNLYKVENVDNLYLAIEDDDHYFPLEKNDIVNETMLISLAETHQLTEIQVSDIQSIMSNYPDVNIELYTPATTGINQYYYGTYRDADYRFIVCKAEARNKEYKIATGPDIASLVKDTIITAVGLTGKYANIGITITAAVLGFLNVDFEYRFEGNNECWARKDEDAYFQYIDFYELGSAYITRGMNAYGNLTIQTTTSYMALDTDGVFREAKREGLSKTGSFGEELTANGLAEKAYGYFQDYYSSGRVRYENYATSFKVGKFSSIPAVSPERAYP